MLFANAQTYNQEGSEVHEDSVAMHQIFEKSLAKSAKARKKQVLWPVGVGLAFLCINCAIGSCVADPPSASNFCKEKPVMASPRVHVCVAAQEGAGGAAREEEGGFGRRGAGEEEGG